MRVFLILLCLALFSEVSPGATYKLTNGKELTGELLTSSATEAGVQVKTGEGQYERVLWGNLSQPDLKELAANPKLQPFVEPFIEITREERLKQTAVNIQEPQRLELPPSRSLLGSLLGSSLGLLVLVSLWAATIYAGYEVALFRGQPPMLVAGLAAIPGLGILSPIIFLAMGTRMKPSEPATEEPITEGSKVAGAGRAATAQDAVNPMQSSEAGHPTSLHLHQEEKKKTTDVIPKPLIFPRGQYTFNRRFIETKFVNFFGTVRRADDRDMVLIIKASRGRFIGHRITRIGANDLHLEVHHGGAVEEVALPFVEIQEIRVQHKDLPQ